MNTSNQGMTPVRLKGMGDGLYVTLDPSQPLDYLQTELTKLFKQMKHLAVNAQVTLDIGGQEGWEERVRELEAFLKKGFGVRSVSLASEKRAMSQEKNRKQDMERSWYHYQSDALMLTGRVRSGQKVSARKHLVILGDVNPGAEVVAGGDILIMGSLRGTAIAGQADHEDAIVLALDFQPTQVQIGGFVAAGLPPSAEKMAEFAHVENGTIVVEDYMEADPFGRLPWPKVR